VELFSWPQEKWSALPFLIQMKMQDAIHQEEQVLKAAALAILRPDLTDRTLSLDEI